ncbi:hypothetical protein K6Y31_20725 [Motilimonas cestriensis]|uniref:DUF3168 domain-containing protein n=1 Tax=Motilimonas cestriensis TaxID=2742685 RepID=A0ABS8WDS9_9GAMM|nr:hypothetical protein [Motilimonas cestriensis]MCE2597202.1 hypothetical protein [Motilimonas cestriensis]
MNLNAALSTWLTDLTGLEAYWLERPATATNAVVYRALSVGIVPGNLAKTNLSEDSYSITVYHTAPDEGQAAANKIMRTLDCYSGELAGYNIELCMFTGGFDQRLNGNSENCYQFNRDFLINHHL